MSCNACAKKYGFFTKEVGCPNCGFSFCSKCVKDSILVPKLEKISKVCCKCFNNLTKGTMSDEIAPPDAYLKRLENLDNPSRPPIIVYQQDQKMLKLKSGMTEKDVQIAERLEKLREERKKMPQPSDSEIQTRLALLKGCDPDIPTEETKSVLPLIDNRSDQQKSDDLLQQYIEEKNIAKNIPSPDCDIVKRLHAMRGLSVTEKEELGNDSSDDEETAAKKLVDRYVAEVALGGVDSDDELEPTPPAEFDAAESWCTICNEDATIQCAQCDNDIYCEECFTKGHAEWGMPDHKPLQLKK